MISAVPRESVTSSVLSNDELKEKLRQLKYKSRIVSAAPVVQESLEQSETEQSPSVQSQTVVIQPFRRIDSNRLTIKKTLVPQLIQAANFEEDRYDTLQKYLRRRPIHCKKMAFNTTNSIDPFTATDGLLFLNENGTAFTFRTSQGD